MEFSACSSRTDTTLHDATTRQEQEQKADWSKMYIGPNMQAAERHTQYITKRTTDRDWSKMQIGPKMHIGPKSSNGKQRAHKGRARCNKDKGTDMTMADTTRGGDRHKAQAKDKANEQRTKRRRPHQ